MKRTMLRWSCVAVLATVSLATAQLRADAPTTSAEDEGRARFRRGVELYKESNFAAALAEFRAAYAAAPSWRIQYNLGQSLYQLQDYAGALAAFGAYLEEGGDQIDAARKAEVEAEMAKLRDRVAALVILTNVPRAELTIDDQPRGVVERRRELSIGAGRHKIALAAEGYRSEARQLDFAGSTRVALTMNLESTRAPTPVAAVPSPPLTLPTVPRRKKSRAPFYVGLIGTGLGAAGTVTLGLLANARHSTYEELLGQTNVDPNEMYGARNDARNLALATDIVGGVTVGLAIYTVIAFVATSGTEPARESRVRPLLTPGGGGLRF